MKSKCVCLLFWRLLVYLLLLLLSLSLSLILLELQALHVHVLAQIVGRVELMRSAIVGAFGAAILHERDVNVTLGHDTLLEIVHVRACHHNTWLLKLLWWQLIIIIRSGAEHTQHGRGAGRQRARAESRHNGYLMANRATRMEFIVAVVVVVVVVCILVCFG